MVTADDQIVDLVAKDHGNWNFYTPDLYSLSDTMAIEQLKPYMELFDQYRCTKMIFEIQLNDNDEFVKQDQPFTTMLTLYDPDSSPKSMTKDMIKRHPKTKRVVMKPGVIYKRVFYPRFESRAINDVSNSNYTIPYKSYFDTADLADQDQSKKLRSANGIIWAFQNYGTETNSILYRTRYYFHFRRRRQTASAVL